MEAGKRRQLLSLIFTTCFQIQKSHTCYSGTHALSKLIIRVDNKKLSIEPSVLAGAIAIGA